MSRTARIIIGLLVLPLGIYWLAGLAGIKSKVWAIVVAVVATLVIGVALGAATGTHSASPQVTTTDQSAPPAPTGSVATTHATRTSATVSEDIRRWGSKMRTWSSNLATAFTQLTKTSENPVGLLTRGSTTQLKAAVALAIMANCSKSLDEIRVPNDPRVHRVVDTLHRACAKFEASATDFASGIDKVNTTLIRRAAGEMAAGSSSALAAAAQVREITSNP